MQPTTGQHIGRSETIVEIVKALVAAQAEIGAAKFDATNPYFKSRYATLGAVIDASRPALTKHGLAVTQPAWIESGTVTVETILVHSSGEWLGSAMALPLGTGKENSIEQIAGKTISYLRRYGYASLVGIYADEDTDGEPPRSNATPDTKPARASKPPTATKPPAGEPKPTAPENPALKRIEPTAEQHNQRIEIGEALMEMYAGNKSAASSACLKLTGKASPKEIPDAELAAAHDAVIAEHTNWTVNHQPGGAA
jgi:hypothetical protein